MTQNVLICYGTRYGSTAEVAGAMATAAREAGAEVTVVDLTDEGVPDIESYDLVIVGSGIQAGQWTKEPLQFLDEYVGTLAEKKTALFVVCGYAASPDKCDMAQLEFLDKIAAKYPGLEPVSTGLFGGVFDFSKYNFAVRFLVKRIVKGQMEPGEEVPEKIDFRDWDAIRDWTLSLLDAP